MNEKNVGNLDVEAILANEELMKKLAAKVLDIIQQKPADGVVCQGYYCDMAKDDRTGDWKTVCKKKLDSLDMELEDGLAASVAEDYPLNAEELDQVVTEIKTSESYAGKLSRTDLSRAVSKVLADNEIMRRKGSAEAMKVDNRTSFPVPCAPNGFSSDINCYKWIAPIMICDYICGPNRPGFPGTSGRPACYPCAPSNPIHFPGSPGYPICKSSGPFFIAEDHDSIPQCPVGYDKGTGIDREDIRVIPGYDELTKRISRLEEAIATPGVEVLGNRINRLEAMVGLKRS